MTNLIYQASNFDVCSDEFDYDLEHSRRKLDFVRQPPVAIAVPVTSNDEIVLVEHWRPILNRTTLECPGGKVDPGETVEAALIRELSEEIGYLPGSITKLGSFFSSVGVSTEEIHCFVVHDLSPVARSSTDRKRMRIHRFTTLAVADILDRGILADGKSEIALARFFRNRSRGDTAKSAQEQGG